MIDFSKFKTEEGIPIYLQIISFVKSGIMAGEMQNGDELPSRRVLSALLGVNPNTVQKAYHLLEEEEIIVSQAGAKSNISVNGKTVALIKAELTESRIKTAVSWVKQMGLSKEEAMSLIERYW